MIPIDPPLAAIEVREDSEGNSWVCLTMQNSAIKVDMYLCDGTNYRRAAAQFHDNILAAGKECSKHRLAVAPGPLPGAALNRSRRNGVPPAS